MSNAVFGVAIVGENKTDKGAKAAEKRLGQIPKHVGVANRRYADETGRSVGRSARGIIRTFGQVAQAGARVFGGRSLTSGIAKRLSGIGEAASAAGTGLGEAAAAGGVLEGTIAAVGVAAAATVGILAAAAYGAFKLADGWAKGAASIGRTAEIMGVGTKAMQEFSAAAERVGVDRDKATGALGGLSETLNDARYGRNTQALAVLTRLGVRMQTNADGTVNVDAMLPAIATAIARQNSSGRRTAARNLGIPIDTLPVFSQGGAALSADMRDADAHAAIIDDAGIATGKRIQRKGVMVGQLKDRAMNAAGRWTAEHAEGGYDAVLSGGRAVADGRAFSAGAGMVERGGRAIGRAADVLSSAVIGTADAQTAPWGGEAGSGFAAGRGRAARPGILAAVPAAQAAERRYGIPAAISLGQDGLESGFGRHMPPGSNNPFGIKARPGEPYVVARTREEDRSGRSYYVNARFRRFASLQEAYDAHARLLQGPRYAAARATTNDDDFADALTHVYATDRHYGRSLRRMIHSNNLDRFDHGANSQEPLPVRVEIDMRGAPPGTRTRVTAGGGRRPAVSQSFQPH